MNTAVDNRSITRFISVLIRHIPDLSEERIKQWLDAPHQLKTFVGGLKDGMSHEHGGVLHFGRLVFSLRIADALLDGQRLGLSQGELVMLLALCEADDVATHEYLVERGRQAGSDWSKTIFVAMQRLRAKIEKLGTPGTEKLITVVTNVGYKVDKEFLSKPD